MKKDRVIKIVLISIIALIVAFGYYLFHRFTGIGIPCPIHEILGIFCPGCGISRMFFAIFELNFYQAFRYNPLLFCYLPFGIILFIDYIVAYVYDKKTVIFKRIPNYCWIILLLITVAFGIIRNIGPFKILAPTDIDPKVVEKNK
jgi:hypothetical protein